MSTPGPFNQQLNAMAQQIAALQAYINAVNIQGQWYALLGSACVYGCKVTAGFSSTDMLLAIDGTADSSHLNPNAITPGPTLPWQYYNIAIVFGSPWYMDQVNVSTIQNTALTVGAAPGAGYWRYDNVFAYMTSAGPNVGIATGAPVVTSSTPADPTLPTGAIALARVVVSAGVTGITNAMIQDLRNFSGRLQGAPGISWTGNWSSATAYTPGQGVFYLDDAWVCTAGNTNVPPARGSSSWSLASAGYNWTGPWSSSTAYNPMDSVFANGSSYVCLAANTNQSPPTPGTSNTYWGTMSQQGATGPTGPTGPAGLNPRGAYNVGTTYALNDWVTSGGASFYSLSSGNVGNALPAAGSSNTYWGTLAAAGNVSGTQLQNSTYTAFAAGGTAPAFTLTANPVPSGYAAFQRFTVQWPSGGAGGDSLNVNGLGAVPLAVYSPSGAKRLTLPNDIKAGTIMDVIYDGVSFVILDPLQAENAPSALRIASTTNLLFQSQTFSTSPWSAVSALVQPMTNQLIQSQNFAAAAWTANAVTATPATNLVPASNALNMWSAFNSATAVSGVSDPFGGSTAWTVTGGSSVAGITTGLTVFSGANHYVSIYLKQGTSSASEIAVYNTGGSTSYAVLQITWSSGVPSTGGSSGSVNSPTYTSVGSGWYRVSFWMAMPAVSAAAVYFYPDTNNTSKTTLVCAAQLEYGATLNAYNATPGNANLLANPNNLAAWSVSSPAPTFTSGQSDPNGTSTAMTVTGGSSATYGYTTATTVASTNYTASVYVKQGTATASEVAVYNGAVSSLIGGVSIAWSSGVPTPTMVGTASGITSTLIGSGWYRISFTVASGSNTTLALVAYPDTSNTSKTTAFWCAQLETGSILNAFNPCSSTTNLDPVAATGAYLLGQATANAAHSVTQAVGKGALAQSWTFSVHLRAGTMSQAAMYLSDSGGSNYAGFASVNLSTGALGTSTSGGSGFSITGSSSSAVSGAPGWYRYTFTVTTNSATSLMVSIYPGTGGTYAGNSSYAVLAYGAQLEVGSSESAYNGTTTASNYIAAPDGTPTAMRLATAQGQTYHYIQQTTSASFTAGQYATASIYAQAWQLSQVVLQLTGTAFPNAPYAFFTLSGAGTVSTFGSILPTATITQLSNGWYRLTVTAPATVSGTALLLVIASAGGSTLTVGDGLSAVAIWGAQLETGQNTGSYVVTTTAAATGSGRAVTNLALDSGQMQTGWAVNAVTVAANAIPAPDGSLTATQIIESATAALHNLSQTITVSPVPTATYTFSCWIKAGARTTAVVTLQSSASGYYAQYTFNLTNGSATLFSSSGASYSAASSYSGNGWWRCSVSVSGLPLGDTSILVAISPNTGSSYLGDGSSGVYVWGGQLEQNGQYVGPGCYVPTTSGAASGAAQVMTSRMLHELDMSKAALTVAFPNTPAAGEYVDIGDAGFNANTNNVTLARNGNLILGSASDYTISTNNFGRQRWTFTLDKGWIQA